MSLSSEGVISRRPTLFRALGAAEPPPVVHVDGVAFLLEAVLKHDSWAATVRYRADDGRCVACKFNRTHPLLLLPAAWIGRRLARREAAVLQVMAGTDGFPRPAGPVTVDGRPVPTAVAHHWIEGETFTPWSPVDDAFFPRLAVMLGRLHARDIAHVDMAKWENLLVGHDGHPYLLDFQIHVRLRRDGPFGAWLALLQAGDRYYMRRQWLRARPDQVTDDQRREWAREPALVRLGEALAPAWRLFRRLVLRASGVRGDPRAPNRRPPPVGEV